MLLPACLLTASPIYRVVDLGSLGGQSSAAAVNSSGQAAGWSLTPSLLIQAMTSAGGAQANALDPANQGQAFGINDAGHSVGIRFDEYSQPVATQWLSDGTAVDLGAAQSYAMAINEGGAAVGSQSGHAVRFTNSGSSDIRVDAPWSAAYGINSGGEVTGTAQRSDGAFRAFVATAGDDVTMLGTLGGRSSYGNAINDAGLIAGAASTVSGYLHAFLWSNGGMQDLGTLTGSANSSAYGINEHGQVVGYSQAAGGASHATLWQNGSLRDLNELIATDSGWLLVEARAVNDGGQIVGFGIFNGEQRAFRLDPLESPDASAVPEPGAIAMLLLGLAGIGARRYFS